ncbi:acetaldehyde dehydrogenase (acetylating) [Sporomusa aerivorans]|uniref:acetaldehyde dehydrogenase (acetylating) n=1 Tax=Sporomusa aerivorans TaxID=204936 RepID=UPI00352B33C9
MGKKLRSAIIGPGNIGIDLMIKLLRSPYHEVVLVSGIDPQSEGLKIASSKGIDTSLEGINGVLAVKDLDICFDATGAKPHLYHAPLLKDAGVFAVDLTPAAVGPYVVPSVNLEQNLGTVMNVNLITCGGQATIPIVHAISRVTPVSYAEIVATISSRSAGPGTRANIDEFTETTRNALVAVGGAQQAKAIIILNPADPPVLMRNTIYAKCDTGKIDEIVASVEKIVADVQKYVPGYRLKVVPYADGERVVAMVEVIGAGDYLPTYSGNLDIITSAAVAVGERYAQYKEGAVS